MDRTARQALAVEGLARSAARIVAGWWEAAAAGLSRQAQNRRVLHRLSAMSDRELRDIGLVRQDVADAALPGNGDASLLLVARREERRGGRHYPGRAP